MTIENMINAITSTIEAMDEAEAVCLWNEFCESSRRYDDRIESMDMLPELFDTSKPEGLFNMLNRFYFGSDDGNNGSSANPNRDYFYFNGYGNIVTTDYPKDCIDAEEVARWIVETDDALYNDDIQEILDSAEAEEE